MSELAVYDNDPTLYLFTSLTAGSSHIVTATSRIETILKANKIPFKGVDTATDDLARKLYGRRAGGRKLPLLVKEGYVIADLEQIEEWNEYDELKDVLGGPSAPAPVTTKPSPAIAAAAAAAPAPNAVTAENTPSANPEQNLAIRQLGAEAAKVAASKKATPANISTTNPLLSEKVNSPAVSSPSGILSPRSVPLPMTPKPATSTPKSPLAEEAPTSAIPKLESKPVDSPPSMHVDVPDPSDAAAPVSTTAKSPTVAPTSPSASTKSPSGEEIKKGEDAEPVAEGSSTVVKDSEEEMAKAAKKDDQVEGGEDEGKKEDKKEEDKKEEDKKEQDKKEEDEKEEVKTQEQDAKDAEKVGESVKD